MPKFCPEQFYVQERIERLRRAMRQAGVEAMLISSPENRRYFSGFKAGDPMLSESSGVLLILCKRQYLFTDSRYVESAEREAPLFEVLNTAKGLGKGIKKAMQHCKQLCYEPESMTVAELARLENAIGPGIMLPSPFNLSEFRVSKDKDELSLIKKALKITESAIANLWDDIEGMTEDEIAWSLDRGFRELGAQGPAFETIVAVGPRASLPHAVPGKVMARAASMAVIDCGARYHGYASDITRTWAGRNLKHWQKKIYAVVRKAQVEAIKAMRPGVTGASIDMVARKIISDAGYGQYFGHGLGHGVGLAVHEEPRLSPKGVAPLPVGAVVTVEPGIYIPGMVGVRLEQLVHLTPNGARVLNGDHHFYDFGAELPNELLEEF